MSWIVKGVVFLILGVAMSTLAGQLEDMVADRFGLEIAWANLILSSSFCIVFLGAVFTWKRLRDPNGDAGILARIAIFGMGIVLGSWQLNPGVVGAPGSLTPQNGFNQALTEVLDLKDAFRSQTQNEFHPVALAFNIYADKKTAILEQVVEVDLTRPARLEGMRRANNPFTWSCASDSSIFDERGAQRRTSFEVLADNGRFESRSISVQKVMQRKATVVLFKAADFPEWSLGPDDPKQVTYRSRICWPSALWRQQDFVLLDLGDFLWPDPREGGGIAVVVNFMSTGVSKLDLFMVKQERDVEGEVVLAKIEHQATPLDESKFGDDGPQGLSLMKPESLKTGTSIRFTPAYGVTAYVLRVRSGEKPSDSESPEEADAGEAQGRK